MNYDKLDYDQLDQLMKAADRRIAEFLRIQDIRSTTTFQTRNSHLWAYVEQISPGDGHEIPGR